MSKHHTPGPWTVLISDPLDTVAVAYDSRFSLPLAIMRKDDLIDRRIHNAKLISAAPELLEVAKLILVEWERPTDGVQVGELIARLSQYSREARAAVKKAEGK